MTDIVERLRETAEWEMILSNIPHTEHIAWKAANEIERLRGLISNIRDCDNLDEVTIKRIKNSLKNI